MLNYQRVFWGILYVGHRRSVHQSANVKQFEHLKNSLVTSTHLFISLHSLNILEHPHIATGAGRVLLTHFIPSLRMSKYHPISGHTAGLQVTWGPCITFFSLKDNQIMLFHWLNLLVCQSRLAWNSTFSIGSSSCSSQTGWGTREYTPKNRRADFSHQGVPFSLSWAPLKKLQSGETPKHGSFNVGETLGRRCFQASKNCPKRGCHRMTVAWFHGRRRIRMTIIIMLFWSDSWF